MCRAIVYLKAEMVADAAARENLETQCGLLAAAHGYRVEQVVLADPKQPLPYTLDEVLKIGPPALIVPALAHIDNRVEEVLEHCALIVGTPYSYRHRHYSGRCTGARAPRAH